MGDILALVKLGWQPGERCAVVENPNAEGYWDVQPEGCPVEQVRTAGDLITKFGSNAVAEAKRRLNDAPGDQLEFWQGVLAVVNERLQ